MKNKTYACIIAAGVLAFALAMFNQPSNEELFAPACDKYETLDESLQRAFKRVCNK